MRKAILTVLLAVFSTSAVAEWVHVGSFTRYIVYVEPGTIRKTGNLVKMSHLYDLRGIEAVAGDQYKSVVAKATYNCKNPQSRTLSAVAYADNMSQPSDRYGRLTINRRRAVTTISEPGKWKSIVPGSTEEILWKFACEK